MMLTRVIDKAARAATSDNLSACRRREARRPVSATIRRRGDGLGCIGMETHSHLIRVSKPCFGGVGFYRFVGEDRSRR
jgi:hypothetical protein